jgi:hypothetical protein
MLADFIIPAIPTGTELTALLVVICFSAGLNLYATVAMLGLLARAHFLALPASLHLLVSWYVIAICGVLFAIEFIGDKIPVFDLVWNAMHTFVRVPAAALLTYAATAQLPEWERLAQHFWELRLHSRHTQEKWRRGRRSRHRPNLSPTWRSAWARICWLCFSPGSRRAMCMRPRQLPWRDWQSSRLPFEPSYERCATCFETPNTHLLTHQSLLRWIDETAASQRVCDETHNLRFEG